MVGSSRSFSPLLRVCWCASHLLESDCPPRSPRPRTSLLLPFRHCRGLLASRSTSVPACKPYCTRQAKARCSRSSAAYTSTLYVHPSACACRMPRGALMHSFRTAPFSRSGPMGRFPSCGRPAAELQHSCRRKQDGASGKAVKAAQEGRHTVSARLLHELTFPIRGWRWATAYC